MNSEKAMTTVNTFVQKIEPKEVLFNFVCEQLEKYKEKHNENWNVLAPRLQAESGVSRSTIIRFVYPEKRANGIVIPRPDTAILLLNAIYKTLSYEQILDLVPVEARSLIEDLRSHTKKEATISTDFDSLIQRNPVAGVLFLMADPIGGVDKRAIIEKLGTNGHETAEKMIEAGFLSYRLGRYYTTKSYPALDYRAKSSLISEISNTGFTKKNKNNEFNFSLGLYRADFSLENYEKARLILRNAYMQIQKLDREDENNLEVRKVNVVYFHGLTVLDDISNELKH